MYNATDTNVFKPKNNEQSKRPVITFIGRFYAIKGFDIYLRAILRIKDQGYRITPHLVGRGDKKRINNILSKNFLEYQLKDNTSYLEMHNIYDKSDIVIVPSLYDNLPGVVLEAMSSGKIVIASNVGGIPEEITHEKNGFLFENESVDDLTKKNKAVLDGTYDIKKIKENARKTVIENFQWKKKAKEIDQIYKKIIL